MCLEAITGKIWNKENSSGLVSVTEDEIRYLKDIISDRKTHDYFIIWNALTKTEKTIEGKDPEQRCLRIKAVVSKSKGNEETEETMELEVITLEPS